jgi:hypothetical protein
LFKKNKNAAKTIITSSMKILTPLEYAQISRPILKLLSLKEKHYFFLMKYRVAPKPFNLFVFLRIETRITRNCCRLVIRIRFERFAFVGSWTDTLSFYVSYVVRRIFTGKRTKCTTRNKKNATASQPLNLVFHNRLNDLLKKFMLIGGMPEAVKTYIGNNMDFVAIQRVLSGITLSYIDDFTKYRKRPLLRLREVMGAVIKQNGGKFIYSKVGNLSNPAQAKEALDLLEMAGLVHKVFHTSGQGIPIAAEVNYKKFKAFLHDTGVFFTKYGNKIIGVFSCRKY